MKLPNYAIMIILAVLFIAGILLRMNSAGGSGYLYFDGISGTNYRYAYQIGQKGTVSEVDRKAAWPEGISIAQSRPLGAEYFTGYLYRLIKYFSDTEERDFVRGLTRFVSTLLLFTLFAITYALWRCQAGALFAAFLVAFHRPLIEATNGSTFLHIHFAAVILSIHALSFIRWRSGFSWMNGIVMSLSSFALMAVWEVAPYCIALFSLIYAIWPGADPDKKRLLLALQTAAFLAAAYFQPYWNVHRIAFSLPAACVYAASIYSFTAGMLPLRRKVPLAGILYLIAGTAILSAFLKPFRTGGLTPFPVVEYSFYRLRYFFEKPANPLLLPDAVRFAWTSDQATPSRYSMFQVFSPLVFFLAAVPVAALNLKKNARRFAERIKGDSPQAVGNRFPILPMALVLLASVAMYVASRSTLVLAMPAIFPLLGLPFSGLRRHILSRGIWIFTGSVLIVTQTFYAEGKLDILRHAALRMNFKPEIGGEFLRISMGDADQNLIRFLLRRTSVRDPMLALPDVSSVLTTFAGRTTLLAPGIETNEMIGKTVSLLDAYYENESELFAVCRETGIDYVIYSAELVLDGSSYSPLYLAGRSQMPPSSTAYRMHFFPEMLTHFTLTYENDNYRLFKVSAEIQPIFTTDHPPIYQYEILDLNNDSLEEFHKRILNLVFLYGSARDEQARGNHQAALGIYERCIGQAPRYTAARLGQAAALSSLGKIAEAKDAYQAIIGYAPDNPEALYGMSLSLARLGETDQAKQYVAILLSSTGDEDMIQRARLLEWFLEEGIPVDSPDSLQTGAP